MALKSVKLKISVAHCKLCIANLPSILNEFKLTNLDNKEYGLFGIVAQGDPTKDLCF